MPIITQKDNSCSKKIRKILMNRYISLKMSNIIIAWKVHFVSRCQSCSNSFPTIAAKWHFNGMWPNKTVTPFYDQAANRLKKTKKLTCKKQHLPAAKGNAFIIKTHTSLHNIFNAIHIVMKDELYGATNAWQIMC